MTKPTLKAHVFPDGDFIKYWWEGDDAWGQLCSRKSKTHGRPFKLDPEALQRKLHKDRDLSWVNDTEDFPIDDSPEAKMV